MSQPAARIGDMHVCPMLTPGVPPIPHVGGPVVKGAPTVLVGNMPQARATDQCVCVGPPDMIAMGSPNVLVCSMPAARMGDPTVHGGTIAVGLPTVLIGSGPSSGGGGGGAVVPGVGGGGGTSGAKATKNTGKSGLEMDAPASSTPPPVVNRPPPASIPAVAMSPNRQASALVQAAQSGTPFCEVCAANSANDDNG
ncbi:MAG: putative Zn-binding protein involved in type VI secretion [Paracoccaceae bacterium]|jgi:uncharacterized Zn-binding protein involved in type VI secretion